MIADDQYNSKDCEIAKLLLCDVLSATVVYLLYYVIIPCPIWDPTLIYVLCDLNDEFIQKSKA